MPPRSSGLCGPRDTPTDRDTTTQSRPTTAPDISSRARGETTARVPARPSNNAGPSACQGDSLLLSPDAAQQIAAAASLAAAGDAGGVQ